MTHPLIRNNTDRNYRKRVNKRNRMIAEMVASDAVDYGKKLLLSLSDDDITLLKSLPHPKIPQSELTLFNYLEWLCGKGYHKKGVKVIEQHVTVGDYKSIRLSEHTESTDD